MASAPLANDQAHEAVLGEKLCAYVPEVVLAWHAEAAELHNSPRNLASGDGERFEVGSLGGSE